MPPAPPSCRIAYALDVNADRAVVVRASRSGRRIQLTTEGRGTTGEMSSLLARIRGELLRDRVVTASAMPLTESFVRWISAPLPTIAKARKVFSSLLDLQLPVPVEQCACVFLHASASAGQAEALALAVRRDDVASRVARLGDWSFTPLIMDHEGAALWEQSTLESPLPAERHRLLIHIGLDRTAVILGRGDRLLATHGSRAPWTAGDIRATSAQLAQRIRQLLQAELGAAQPDVQYMLSGPGCDQPPLVDELRRILPAAPASHSDPDAFLARAVARRALERSEQQVNFLTDALEPALITQRRERRELRVLRSCAAAALLLCAADIAWLGLMTHQKSRLQDEITALAEELSGSPHVPRGQEVMTVQRALDEKSPSLQPFRAATRRSFLTVLAPLLDIAQAQHLILDGLTIGAGQLEARGSAPNKAACDALSAALRNDDWQTDVHQDETDGRVRFVVKGFR